MFDPFTNIKKIKITNIKIVLYIPKHKIKKHMLIALVVSFYQ